MQINAGDLRCILMLTNPESELLEAFDCALNSGSIFKDRACPVLDTHNNSLVVDGIYQYRDISIKVRSWAFGSGNMLDRYYRVYYTDSNLKDTFTVVNADYPDGVFGGAVYPSKFIPIN